jgi:hypothetical protein
MAWSVYGWQARVRQCKDTVRIVFNGVRQRHLLGFVEYSVFEFLAARGEALELREAKLLLELLDALSELLVAGLEFADIGENFGWQTGSGIV